MTKSVLPIACVALTPFAAAVALIASSQTPVAQSPQTPPVTAARAQQSPQRALLDRYCVGCHNERAKAAGQEPARKITLDDLDVEHVGEHAEVWERVVRKLRAGMMPPAGARRPDKAAYTGFVTWLESELDRTAAPYAPPPGLHRLNRTEYGNVIRDVLDLDVDVASLLPSDDSTHGFDNIAAAQGWLFDWGAPRTRRGARRQVARHPRSSQSRQFAQPAQRDSEDDRAVHHHRGTAHGGRHLPADQPRADPRSRSAFHA